MIIDVAPGRINSVGGIFSHDPHCSESFDCSNAAADAAVLSLFHPIVREWWLSSFGSAKGLFTPAQRQAAPLIQQGKNVLICSPTGSGKTLSAVISIINQLFLMAERGEVDHRRKAFGHVLKQVGHNESIIIRRKNKSRGSCAYLCQQIRV